MFRRSADDIERTAKIVSDLELAFNQGRKILVLIERTKHVDALDVELKGRVHKLFTRQGRVLKKNSESLHARA